MFPKYPYLDLSDRNLDFLTKAIREMENEVKNFVTLNAVKYANPIQWSINRQYEKNTIVIDPLTGTAFISVQPVPSGVALTRTQYWTPVFDLSQFVTKAASNFANTYERNITTTATMSTGAGDWLVWDSTLYVALTSIHAGDAYVVNGNIKRMTVEDFYDLLMQAIHSLNEELDTEIRNRTDADTTLQGNIDAEALARQSAVNDEANVRNQADVAIGDRITQVSDFFANAIGAREFNWFNRKFLLCGDSYGDEEGEWTSLLISNYKLAGRSYNLCVGGAGFVSGGSPYLFIEQIQNFASSHASELSTITDIVVCGGLNDSFSYEISAYSAVADAMDNFDTYVKSVMPYARISLGYIGNGNDTAQGSLISGRVYRCRQICRYIYYNKASQLGWNILHNVEYALTGSPANIGSDGVHPSAFGSYELARAIGSALVSGSADCNYPIYDAQVTPTIGSLTSGYINYKIHNETAEIMSGSLVITVNGGTTLVGGVSAHIMTLGGMYFNSPVNVNVICTLYNATVGTSGTDAINVKGRLTFSENKVYLAIFEADGTGYVNTTWSSAGTLSIVDFEKCFDSMILV